VSLSSNVTAEAGIMMERRENQNFFINRGSYLRLFGGRFVIQFPSSKLIGVVVDEIAT
jgi:hypothetical protein